MLVVYGDEALNIRKFVSFTKGEDRVILFYLDETRYIVWDFKDNSERDEVYEKIIEAYGIQNVLFV
jgi:hypothetical protein